MKRDLNDEFLLLTDVEKARKEYLAEKDPLKKAILKRVFRAEKNKEKMIGKKKSDYKTQHQGSCNSKGN